MPHGKWERFSGPIRGLRLPLNAWDALRREGITTIGQLRAVADRLETLPGIGPKTAHLIREELARAMSSHTA
jgi:DNA-directed RNA polymerase alpha subunit